LDGMKSGCPDDSTLEAYIYGDLGALERLRVLAHFPVCPACRERLEGLRRFSEALSEMPLEEPPAGFASDLVRAIDTWGVPTPGAAEEEGEQTRPVRGTALRLRWVLGAFVFLVSSFVQWRYGDYLPRYLSGNYVFSLKGLQTLWDFVRSGALWQSIRQIFAAIQTDGLSALGILGTTIPVQIAGVIVFGGIVTAVFISQLKASRNRGEGHR